MGPCTLTQGHKTIARTGIPTISVGCNSQHADQRGNGQPGRHLHDPRYPAILPLASLLSRLLALYSVTAFVSDKVCNLWLGNFNADRGVWIDHFHLPKYVPASPVTGGIRIIEVYLRERCEGVACVGAWRQCSCPASATVLQSPGATDSVQCHLDHQLVRDG